MAEKVLYEVALEGVSSVVNAIGGLENALSSIKFGGIAELNGHFVEMISHLRTIAHIAPDAMSSINKSQYFKVTTPAKMVTAGWMGNIPEAVGKWNQSWAKQFKTHWVVDDEGNMKRVYDEGWGAPSNFMADFARARNRMSNDWGTLRQRARSMLMQSFGYTPLLGWDTGAGFTTGEIGATSMKDNLAARDSIAKIHREYFRDLKSKFYAPTVWQGGVPAVVNPTGTALATLNNKYGIVNTGKVTDPGYIDADWSYVGAGSMSGTRATMIDGGAPLQLEDKSGGALAMPMKNMIPKATMISRIIGSLGKINAFATAIQAALRGVKFVIGAIKKFVNGLAELGHALAETSWRQLRESFAYGTSIGSLARAERAMAGIGGDPASASALWGRWAKERSMLAYGGNGGSMMEAARLFGIGIMGSGEYGFATQDEFLRNVIDAMTKATPERRNAIAGTLGLTPYQTWAFSHGQAYYDTLGRKSLVDNIAGDELENKYRTLSGGNARRFEGAWGEFMESLKELGSTLGDMILPHLTIFIDLLEGLCEIVNLLLKPLSLIDQFFTNLFSARWWQEQIASVPTKEQNAMQMQAVTNNGKNLVINVGDLNMSSLPSDVSSSDAAGRYAREIFDRLGELAINDRR